MFIKENCTKCVHICTQCCSCVTLNKTLMLLRVHIIGLQKVYKAYNSYTLNPKSPRYLGDFSISMRYHYTYLYNGYNCIMKQN